ncbi:Bug family tripartite tricarboxylate transporter substrate binding protein [Neoroseomonas rubea]|uniref:Bug family tripartite tricarboxylate transporter substrate binding protein n=1 Tax=Neoroseomonas rubea TaxID=2748666 RepID=UPI0018DF976B|nr:tripartite tricarboxylate transporter substrate-binding protein [Roseomonas rubea]
MNRRGLIATTGSLALAGHAAAQPAWPDRAVTIVVPFGAGTAPDLMARLAAPRLSARWGQPVVVQNVVGAAGVVGVERVARAAPDGHTLVLPGDAAIVVRISMTPRPPYDPQRDLAPIMLVGRTTNVLVVASQTPYRSLADIVAAARAQPGTITFGHAGTGTSQHIGGEMLAQMAGVRLTGVAYNDLGAMAIDVQSGRVTMSLMGSVNALPRVRDGSLRALGVSTPARFAALPEVPSIAEQGLPGFDASAWFGLYAPAGTPAAIVARINRDMRAALEQPEARSRFDTLGVDLVAGTPEELARTIATEIPRMRAVLRAAGVEGA